MNRITSTLTRTFILGLLTALSVYSQSTSPINLVHVPGQVLTSTAAYLATTEAHHPSGPTTTQNTINIGTLTISNTDSVAHTPTIQDCQGTPAVLMDGSMSIPAHTIWTITVGDLRMVGCVSFKVDSGGTAGKVWVWMSGTW
jgi:hypothetical protein